MIPAIVPLLTEVAADFGIGYIVHGGVTSAVHYGSLSLAKKACVATAELAVVGMGCDIVNEYIDLQFEKLGQFIVDHDLDEKFMKKGDK